MMAACFGRTPVPASSTIGTAGKHAVGVRVRDLPLTRERVARAIEES